MNSRRSPARNQRRSARSRGQSFLEVSVRPHLASQRRNRRIMIWTCKLLLLAGLVGGSIYGVKEGLRHFLWENPEYDLAVVEINNDGSGVSREMILGATGLEVGKNIFSVSLAEARKSLVDLPQVDHVELRRVLPNKITIDLTERRPVGWLTYHEEADPSLSESAFLIDDKGVLFKPKRLLTEYLRLPVISGVETGNFLPGETVALHEVQAALNLIRLSGDTGIFQIQGINLSKGYCMVVNDIRNKQVLFPLDEIEHHLERLTAVFDYATANQKQIQTVNLLVERNIPITEVGSLPPPSADGGKAIGGGKDEKGVAGEGETAKLPAASASSTTKTATKATTKTSRAQNSQKSTSKKSTSSSSSKQSSSKQKPANSSTKVKASSAKPTPPKRVERDVLRAIPTR